METNRETYFVDFGQGSVYYQVVDRAIFADGKRSAVSIDKFLDFIATAKELGHKAGRL